MSSSLALPDVLVLDKSQQAYFAESGVLRQNNATSTQNFQTLYTHVRDAEQRLLTDALVRDLPHVPATYCHYHEWQLRAKTAHRFGAYLRKKALSGCWVLEVGCGNGWFAHQISQHSGANVLGVDVNQLELQQAARVFGAPGLWFADLDFFNAPMQPKSFQLIVFNASIQYFADFPQVVARAMALLAADGELHIMDSPFYAQTACAAAQQRSEQYYSAKGVAELAAYYHHHAYETLLAFQPTFLYRPSRILRKIAPQRTNPFPWVRIVKKAGS
jgi:ubiquinone/menaquinone biosynthesis C-methylase UbiE